MEIFNPSGLENYASYFSTVLSISGVLFGLAFAVLLFIIQSGFSSFQYSRRMFLELYVHFGKNLLTSLAYLTIMPLLILYAKQHWWVINATYIWFFIFYLKTILDYQYQLGYITTINSNKYIPEHFGKLRSYFRSITNLGFIHNIVLWFLTATILIYPVIISFTETKTISITEKGIFYSSILVMILTILKIKNFIPELFELSNQELDYKEEVREDDDTTVDNKVEFDVFEKYLRSNEVTELDPHDEREFLDGGLWLQFLKDKRSEIWFNIHISVTDVTNIEVRDEVCAYAIYILSLFSRSKVDLNKIVLSFHVKIEDDTKHSRNIFIRTNRLELSNIDFDLGNPVEEIVKLENSHFDKLFRNIPYNQ